MNTIRPLTKCCAGPSTAIIFLLLLVPTLKINAQPWAYNLGSTAGDRGKAIALAPDGDILTTGEFMGTMTVNTVGGPVTLVSNGVTDILITRTAPDGSIRWAKSIGGPESDEGRAIAVDSQGNAVISGSFYGTMDSDPGPGVANLSIAVNNTIFLLKLDPNGDFIWSGQFGSTSTGGAESFAVACDTDDNMILSGTFNNTADFDPGPGTAMLSAVGGGDGFLCKLAPDGTFIWVKELSGNSFNTDYIYAIATDAANNVYATGPYNGTMDLEPGPGSFPVTAINQTDLYVVKLSSAGVFQWGASLGGNGWCYPNAIAVSLSGQVLIAGDFQIELDVDPGTAQQVLTSSGGQDAFLVVLDAQGGYEWHAHMYSDGIENAVLRSLAIGSQGDIHLSGTFSGTLDMDPGTGTALATAGSFSDVFYTRLTSSGAFVSAQAHGGGTEQVITSMAVNAMDDVYATGRFAGAFNIGKLQAPLPLTSNGGFDLFLAKLGAGTTAINERSDAAVINVFPNPFTDRITLQHASTSHRTQVVLRDALGRILHEQQWRDRTLELQPQNAVGVFFLSITDMDSGASQHIKLIHND